MKRKLITIKCASDLTNRQLERLIRADLGVPGWNRVTVTDLTRRKPPKRATKP